ncbi:MAG TPA: hypothetical protein VJK52_00385 [Candidatus Nanoarchaeia archaeon]|nr:hypothetical protein [Candidatus Nanoarchaeia archaeon]
MQKAIFLFLLMILLPAAHAVGIGMLNTIVPVAKRTTTPLTIYLSNPTDTEVLVDLSVEGNLAKYVKLSRSPFVVPAKGILPVQASVTFKTTIPWHGSALIIATERSQESQSQIGAVVKTAVPIRFDFNPKARSEPIQVLQQPAQERPAQSGLTIGDYTITSPTLRTAAVSTSALLFVIIALLLGFDFQILHHRRKTTEHIQDILKR